MAVHATALVCGHHRVAQLGLGSVAAYPCPHRVLLRSKHNGIVRAMPRVRVALGLSSTSCYTTRVGFA